MELRDQRLGIPKSNISINKPTSNDSIRELLRIGLTFPPRQPIIPLWTRNRTCEFQLLIIRYEINLKNVEISSGAERQIHRSRHRSSRQIRCLRREGRRSRSVHHLYARHRISKSKLKLSTRHLNQKSNWYRLRILCIDFEMKRKWRDLGLGFEKLGSKLFLQIDRDGEERGQSVESLLCLFFLWKLINFFF